MRNYNMLHNRPSNNQKAKRRPNYPRIGIVAGVMLLAMLAGYFLSDRPDSSGGRVAAAANRVNEQVNDTRQDFQEIQALALEAQAPTAIMQESMSGGGAPAEATAQQEPEPAPGSLPGIPAGDQTVGSIVAIPGDGQAEGNRGDDKAAPPATLTFNEKARAIQGEAPLTVHQEAAQRLVDSWGPQYDAAVAEHNSLMLRIRETRALWQEYREEQTSLIEEMHNPELRASMAMDLRSDIAAYEEWNINAEQVEVRSSTAMTKLHDMNRAIQFQRNRADFRALIGGESVGMSLQVTLLLESLDTFESRTNALSAAISAG